MPIDYSDRSKFVASVVDTALNSKDKFPSFPRQSVDNWPVAQTIVEEIVGIPYPREGGISLANATSIVQVVNHGIDVNTGRIRVHLVGRSSTEEVDLKDIGEFVVVPEPLMRKAFDGNPTGYSQYKKVLKVAGVETE